MKKNIFILFIVSFCLTGGACNQGSVDTIPSNSVMSSQVYQIYDVQANKSRTDITATFRVGGATGTTLALTAPGKVFYNAAEMPKSDPSNLIGTSYRMKGTDYRTFSKIYKAAHDFSFTDNDGKTYANSITLAPLEIIDGADFALQNNQPTTIPLSRSVGANEKLTIALETVIDDEIPTADNSVYFNQSRNAIVITPKYWEKKSLKSKVEMEIEISKTASVSQGTPLGGSISIKYSAAPVYVSVSTAKNMTTNSNSGKNADANISASTNAAPKTANADMKTSPKSNANVSDPKKETGKLSPQ